MAAQWSCRLAAVIVLLLGSVPLLVADRSVAAATADQPGELWEVTSRMAMEGLPIELPAQTMRICAAKQWQSPPAGMDERQKCEASNFQLVDDTATWDVTCQGPPAMTGHGEVVRNGNAYSGLIKFVSAEGNMTLKLDGRLIGGCDNPS